MGALIFGKGIFADHLHEIVGCKAGLAVSIEHICDLLTNHGDADKVRSSEDVGLRIRSEDYESLYYDLLYKVGVTEKPYTGIFAIFDLNRDLAKRHGERFSENIFKLYQKWYSTAIEVAVRTGEKLLNPTPVLMEAKKIYGMKGVNAIIEIMDEYEKMIRFNPHSRNKFSEWRNVLDLDSLFSKYQKNSTYGEYFDQRFIDFLSVNNDKLATIHWRKFEELIGECFIKFGYQVEIGPGSNDDGVDVRVWSEKTNCAPKYIIQCKKQKDKIDKVTVKGLYADVVAEGAEMGLLVTTSEFSLGARKTVDVRGYPIEEVDGKMIGMWLSQLRTPGTGIVRS